MNTDTYSAIVDATRADYQKHILSNELLALLAKGGVTIEHYVAYLRETFHLVRHTSRALALAASRIEDEHRGLRSWLLSQANEEHGHELFCLKDLRALGQPTAEVIASDPGPGAWGIVTQNYYLATQGHCTAILGVASATEQMGAELAGALSGLVAQKLAVDTNALTFLRSHSSFDVKHLEEAKNAINEFAVGDIARQQIILARRHTFRNYGQLFSDVAGITTSSARQLAAA